MSEFSEEDKAKRKKAIFDSMSMRGQKSILKRGYEQWDPFLEPKDPIDIRRDKTKRTTKQLVREFLVTKDLETYNNAYGNGALELCLGLMNEDAKYKAMYEFSVWYYKMQLQEKEKSIDPVSEKGE